ncbi:PepSY-associated TM helix domain-containing protein [Neobacillus rhizosphaerae]|uniref:PepSY-associated TM helix domain-containing protein n=1 Tax=Neobacillus rhizosphaerae TaxID=2880965 RepID=UPI003D274068
MKKMRRAHLWIGLIASVLIFMESITGLLMNEPWLIGQTQMEGERGNFQQGQFNRGQFRQGEGQANGFNGTNPSQGQAGVQGGQVQGPGGFGRNGNFPEGFRGERMGQGSFMSTIRGLHEGRIGNTDVKWLIDLAAIAMIFLTGSGIYLSVQILRADSKKRKRQLENMEVL